MIPTCRHLLALALVTAGSGAAQALWIVDAAGGPGHHFRDLPPAVLAAAPGDRILVRAGAYQVFATNKGLTLIGEPGAVFQATVQQATGVRVTNLPAGQTFALQGFGTAANAVLPAPMVEAVNCAGRVHFDRLVLVNPPIVFGGGFPCMRVDGCPAVTVTGCALTGTPGLHAITSTVAVTGSRLTGNPATAFQEVLRPAGPGLVADRSQVAAARTTALGGAGIDISSFGFMPPAPAVQSTASGLDLLSDANDFLQGGRPARGQGAAAIRIAGGALLLDPTLVLLPSGSAPAIEGTPASFVSERRPALRVAGAGPGNRVNADLYAVAGHAAVLLLSTPTAPLATPFGPLWLAPAALVAPDATVIDGTEHWTVALDLPPDPALRGVHLCWQTVSGGAVGPWWLASPAVTVVND